LRGYFVDEKPAANASDNPPNPFLVLARNQAVVNSWTVREFREFFEGLASFHNGDYDGWEAAAQP
jgi:hypothetical protein